MNLFGCKFCETMKGSSDVECDRKNFDSLLWAIVTVFQVPTKKKDTFPRIFSRAFLISLYSVYYTYIYIYSCILTLLHRIYLLYIHTLSTLSIYTYTIHVWFIDKLKSCDRNVRLPTLYMISEVSGNVYWEKNFSACRHFSDRGKGGKEATRRRGYRHRFILIKYLNIFPRGIIASNFQFIKFVTL